MKMEFLSVCCMEFCQRYCTDMIHSLHCEGFVRLKDSDYDRPAGSPGQNSKSSPHQFCQDLWGQII